MGTPILLADEGRGPHLCALQHKYNLARQHQDVDRAVVGGSSEGNEGPFSSQWRKIVLVHDAVKPLATEKD